MPVYRPICRALILFLFSVAAPAQVTQSRPMPQTVKVQVDPTGNLGSVPAHIFGSFLEPIDNSINNGVIAEILVNGSLEAGLWNHAMLEQIFRDQPDLIESSNQTGIPIPWQPLNRSAGNRYELHVGDAANSWQSLEMMGTPDDLTGIRQRVYLPVPRTYGYNVSLRQACERTLAFEYLSALSRLRQSACDGSSRRTGRRVDQIHHQATTQTRRRTPPGASGLRCVRRGRRACRC